MDRYEATESVTEAKRQKGLTCAAIAERMGRSKEWTTAALLGQSSMSPEEARRAADVLELGPEVVAVRRSAQRKGRWRRTSPPTRSSTGSTTSHRFTGPR